jgi:hypothetical protein
VVPPQITKSIGAKKGMGVGTVLEDEHGDDSDDDDTELIDEELKTVDIDRLREVCMCSLRACMCMCDCAAACARYRIDAALSLCSLPWRRCGGTTATPWRGCAAPQTPVDLQTPWRTSRGAARVWRRRRHRHCRRRSRSPVTACGWSGCTATLVRCGPERVSARALCWARARC